MAGLKQPDDHSHFLLPDLGEGVAEAELIKWRVKPGDAIEEMETIAEMETDKALVEVPAPWSGVVKELPHNEGDIVKVGSILLTFDIGDRATAAVNEAAVAEAAASEVAERREDAGTVVGSVGGEVTISDRFARRPETEGNGAVGQKALATPAVRRIARELGVQIDLIAGTGRGGRVTASDVRAYAGDTGAAITQPTAPLAQPTIAPPPVDGEGVAERIPFMGVRRKIAQALDLSVKTAVHFTVVDEADVTELDQRRREYAAVLGQKLSFLPLILTAVCRALRLHPTLNANVDDQNAEILIKGVINLGIAVDTDHGLMVPILENADQLNIAGMSSTIAELAAGCRDRSIAREKLSGGTFTISNVGSYGGRFATPIINYPEVAILAAGRVYEKVQTRDGVFYAGTALPLSLSCDHRVVDGAEGARFLNTIVKLLESPGELVR